LNRALTQLLLSCLLYCAVMGANAEPLVAIVNNLAEPFDLNPYLETIEDVNHEYTLEDIQAGKYDDLWRVNKERYFSGRNVKSKYWFRVSFQYNQGHEEAGIVYIANHPQLIYRLGVLLPDRHDTQTRLVETGSLTPFRRDIPSLHYGFKIGLEPHQAQQIIGWINNEDSAVTPLLPLYLVSEKQFAEINQDVANLLTAFYAVMGALLIYNTCLYLTLRQSVYGLYLFFLINAVLICSISDGSSGRWLLPDSPILNHRIGSTCPTLMITAYLAFVVQSLNGVPYWPRFRFFYRGLLGTGLLFYLIGIFIPSLYVASLITEILPILILPTTLIIIISSMLKRVPTTGYLLIAEVLTISGVTTFMLMIKGLISINPITFWSFHWGFLGEALLLSLAVAARTNIAIQEKLKAQQLAYENERKALAALEMATQTKNQFLTTVSHELRTPLNSIIGFSNVLLDNQQIKGADRDHAQTILNNGKQLLAVVNDVLNLSLIDSNRLALTARVVDLLRLLQGLEAKYRLIAQKTGISLKFTLDKQLPPLIEIDDEHLMQILKQLLDNAFKFTHQGHVTLSAAMIEHSLVCTLTDTGIGIPTDKLAQIFEPFTQADSSNTRRYSGTGVGLFIAKSIAEKMNGTLSVESTVGVGTRFDLVLPILVEQVTTLEELQINPVTTERPLLRGRVLYAEDNLDNQQLVKILVSTTGAEVTLVENGVAAIDAVNNAELPFDLVLMDLQMPVMDGYEAAEMLKRNGCNAPVIACSASALAEIASNNEVVFAGYLGKPIDKMKLYAVLSEYLAGED